MAHSRFSAFVGGRLASGRNELGPGDVQPFGTNGVGLVTGHPVGLLLVIGVILIAITGVPAVRWFFGGALLLGGAIGCLLWLHGR